MTNSFALKSSGYSLELAQLVEVLKVEGSWLNKGAISIYNKSPELISFFSKLFQHHSIKFFVKYNLKIIIPAEYNDFTKLVLLENGVRKNFNFEKNVFKNCVDRLAFETNCKKATYILKDDVTSSSFYSNISEEKFESSNGLSIYAKVLANNRAFVKFLEDTIFEKGGTYEIRVSGSLKSASPGIIAKVFGSVVDCEGSIRFKGLTRNIRLRMNNNDYLADWSQLLAKLGIFSNHSYRCLTITNNQNFQRLSDLGFTLMHPVKDERFKRILKNYKKRQILRNTSENFYIQKLKDVKEISASELSIKLNKSKRVVSHFLTKLERSGKISANKSSLPYIYYIDS